MAAWPWSRRFDRRAPGRQYEHEGHGTVFLLSGGSRVTSNKIQVVTVARAPTPSSPTSWTSRRLLGEAAWTAAAPEPCARLPGTSPSPCAVLSCSRRSAVRSGQRRPRVPPRDGRVAGFERHPHAGRVFSPGLYCPSVLISSRPVVARGEPTPPGNAGRLRCGRRRRRFPQRLPRKWGSTRRPERPTAGNAGEPLRARAPDRSV